MDNEYINYITYTKLLNLVDNKYCKKWKNIIELQLLLRIKYKIKNGIEPFDGYYKITDKEYEYIYNDMQKELKNYNIDKKKLTKQFIDIINNKNEIILDGNNSIKINKKYIYYRNLKFNLDERINFLIKQTSIEKVIRMLLRYSSLGITGNQCSITSNVYNFLYDNLNIKGEGFCSPLNSKLITKKNTKICTLFKDTDKYFGSLGPFSSDILIQNQNINWLLNPPYMPSYIRYVWYEIINTFQNIDNDIFLIILVIPKWKSKTYTKIIKSEYNIGYLDIDPDEHYMNCNGEIRHMNKIRNNMFFLSKNKNLINENILNNVKKIWNTYEKVDTNQSLFIGPKFNK